MQTSNDAEKSKTGTEEKEEKEEKEQKEEKAEEVRLRSECNSVATDIAGREINISDWQFEAIIKLRHKENVLINARPGSGKSMIYQILPLLSNPTDKPIVVIFPPLVSIITDQVNSLRERGIRAVRYPSVDPDSATREIQDQQTKDAHNTHVYITPEYVIETDDGILLHLNKHIILAVMDEADLYSKWGDGFRVSLSQMQTVTAKLDCKVLLLSGSWLDGMKQWTLKLFGVLGANEMNTCLNNPKMKIYAKKGSIEQLRWIGDLLRAREDCPKIMVMVRSTGELNKLCALIKDQAQEGYHIKLGSEATHWSAGRAAPYSTRPVRS